MTDKHLMDIIKSKYPQATVTRTGDRLTATLSSRRGITAETLHRRFDGTILTVTGYGYTPQSDEYFIRLKTDE